MAMSNVIEEKGLEVVTTYLKRHPEAANWWHLLEDKDAQKFGDLCLSVHGVKRNVEVKTERKSTGNVFIELIARISDDFAGWGVYCKADWIWYVFLDNPGVIYAWKLSDFRNWFFCSDENRYEYYRLVKQKVSSKNMAIGYIVPIPDMREQSWFHEYYLDDQVKKERSALASKVNKSLAIMRRHLGTKEAI